jgi:hypothetical protein
MNNVDIAITKLRELQQMFYSSDASPNSLFKKSQEVIQHMDKASIEIRQNYAEISKKLTDQMNTGRVQE